MKTSGFGTPEGDAVFDSIRKAVRTHYRKNPLKCGICGQRECMKGPRGKLQNICAACNDGTQTVQLR